ncbi:MAG: hypothetical protein NTX38_03400 [Methylobacter sp.]|nr:hypothetical protein [Methylobacter sp.]
MSAIAARQAMKNLRDALLSCHLEKTSVSPFDVEMVLYQIENLPASQNANLTKKSMINRIQDKSTDNRILEALEYLNSSLMACHQDNVEIEPLNVYGLIFDILRLMRGETDFIKLPMVDLERAIYAQLRGQPCK